MHGVLLLDDIYIERAPRIFVGTVLGGWSHAESSYHRKEGSVAKGMRSLFRYIAICVKGLVPPLPTAGALCNVEKIVS